MNGEFSMFADNKDITAYAGNVTWQNTIDELSTSVTFETAKTDTKYLNFYAPVEGSIIRINTDEDIFKGIVVSVDDGSKTSNKYTVCDFGWFLNKSSETYQFNKMIAKKAITKICEDYGITIDSIPELNTEITQLYLDKTLSDIIKDILEICGGRYNLDMTPKGLRIYKLGDIRANPQFRISPNTRLVSSIQLRGNVSHSTSIEEMKNSIKVVSEKDGVYAVLKTKKDDVNIGRYGLLQQVVKIDPEKENANTVADTNLAELNRKSESFSFEVVERMTDYTRAGAVISVSGSDYLVEGSSHSYKSGIHYVKLDLRRWVA